MLTVPFPCTTPGCDAIVDVPEGAVKYDEYFEPEDVVCDDCNYATIPEDVRSMRAASADDVARWEIVLVDMPERSGGVMTVTVRDRSAEAAAWGQPGLFHPILRTVSIADRCPRCGGPRGTPTRQPFYEDGVTFSVDCWTNFCGHIDHYADVLEEAQR